MGRNIFTGIDIGTSNIRVVVSEYVKENKMPKIIGTGTTESRGLRHGYIVNINEAAESIREAVSQAEKQANIKIKKAFIAIGGLSLESTISSSSVFISRADGEVTEMDIKNAVEASEEKIDHISNKQIIHSIPIIYKLDNEEILGNPVGMKGTRFEVTTLFVTCLTQHLNDFVSATEEAGINVEDIMASPIAASFITLNKRQKVAGCILANIGAETLSIAVFENNLPISIKVFPIGGVEITNDIALGLKIPLDEAEQIKLGEHITSIPKKKLEDIIEARLSDIFDLIDSHLKKIGRQGLLPAGVIITGGTAALPIVENLARASLKLPSKVITPDIIKNADGYIADATWAVAYGLCIMGLDRENEDITGIKLIKRTRSSFYQWVKQFLP